MKASITVFASLVLSLIVLLNCVLVDTARIISSKKDLERRAHLAADSVLAGFDSILRDHYKIFAIDGSKNLKDEYLNYIGRNYTLKDLDIGLEGALTEGDYLQEQIVEEMIGQIPLKLFECLLEKLDIIKDGDRQSDFYKHELEINIVLSKIDEKIEKLYRSVEGYYKGDPLCVNGYDRFNKHLTYLGSIKAFIDFLEGKGGEREGLTKKLRENLLQIHIETNAYLIHNINALEEITSLQAIKEEADIKVKEMEALLETYQLDESRDIVSIESFKGQISKLKSKINYMTNSHLIKPLSKNIGILNRINKGTEGLLSKIEADIEDLDIKEIKAYFEDINTSGMELNLRVRREATSSDPTLLALDKRDEAQKVLEGLFKKEVKKTISNDVYRSLPSVLNNITSSELLDKLDNSITLNSVNALYSLLSFKDMVTDIKEGPGQYLLENFCVDQYILTFFNNSVNAKNMRGAFFRSEIEYLLAGTSDEGLNELVCKSLIFGIRFNLNFVYLLTDSEKVELANSVGDAIAAAISCGIGGPIYGMLILASWAIFESAIDLKDLSAGKSSPLIKSKDSWQTSIEGQLTKLLKEKEGLFSVVYEDYLVILLTFTPKEAKLMRICDLIDINISSFSNNRYYSSKMHTRLKISFKLCVKSLSQELLYKKEEGFDLEVAFSVAY